MTLAHKHVLVLAGGRAWKFKLSYYPHRLKDFSALLKGLFGENAKHRVFADFKPLDEGPECPASYMHIIKKPL